MKKNYLLTAILTSWMLLLGLTAQAQNAVEYCPSGVKSPALRTSSWSHQAVEEARTQQALRKPAEGEVTIKIHLDYDEEQFRTQGIVRVVNEQHIYFAMDMGEGACEAQVLPGTYDIVAVFNRGLTPYYVIRELVEISADTELTLSPTEATNYIGVKNYGPDGELLKHSFGYFDHEAEEWVRTAEGNVEITDVANVVYLKGIISFGGGSCTFVSDMDEEMGQELEAYNYHVSDVSNRYLFTQSRVACNEDLSKQYCSYFSTDNVKVGYMENNPSAYVLSTETWEYSPYGKGQEGYGDGTIIYHVEGNLAGGYSAHTIGMFAPRPADVQKQELYVNAPYTDPNNSDLHVIFGSVLLDHVGTVTNPWTGEEREDFVGKTFGTAYKIENGQKVMVNVGHYAFTDYGITQNSLYQVEYESMGYPGLRCQMLPAPVAFTYPAEQRLGNYGDNCPINAIKLENYYDTNQKRKAINLTNYFVGRYGETRWCDEERTTLALKFNGEEVADLSAWTPEGEGTFEFTCTNTNIEVDGLQGKNTTVVYFDERQDDMTPPAIEMLHFRSDAGITDRFATAADGTMEFYAGDFNYNYNPELWDGVYDCKPLTVKVEYAPYGKDDWKEVSITEVPELYQMPGWGYFYRASLADVEGVARKGWFDLKFTLTDEAGNWQEQTVSPAFRIDNLIDTGVERVAAPTDGTDRIYTLGGQRIDASLGSLPHGIYIVNGKKVVK